MFNLNEFIITNTVNGAKNGTFTKEYANIMAVNYMLKGVLTQDNIISINAQIEAWEFEQTQKAEISENYTLDEKIINDEENVAESGEYEATEGNEEDILKEENENPIDLEDDGQPLS